MKRMCACEQTEEVLKLGHFRWMKSLKTYLNLLGGKDYLREKCTQGNAYSKKSENYSYTSNVLNHFCKGDTALIIRSWLKTLKQFESNTSSICNKKWYKDATWSCANLSGKIWFTFLFLIQYLVLCQVSSATSSYSTQYTRVWADLVALFIM